MDKQVEKIVGGWGIDPLAKTQKPKKERVFVTWVLGKAFGFKGNKGKAWLAICNRTKKVFRITGGPLEPLIIHDILLTSNGCEEGARCLYRECEFNKTTPESYIRSMSWNIRGKKLKEFKKVFYEGSPINKENLSRYAQGSGVIMPRVKGETP